MKNIGPTGTWTHYTEDAGKLRRELRTNAWQALEELEPGGTLCILTKGQFSLIDLIRACLDRVGPASVIVSTWTAAKREIGDAEDLLREGRIKDLRWLVDFSFCRRQPAYAELLRERFGDACIRSTMNHAKFVIVRGADAVITIRTSMNLNKNTRFEYADVSYSPELAEFFGAVVDEVFEEQQIGLWIEGRPRDSKASFDKFGTEAETIKNGRYGSDLTNHHSPGFSKWPKPQTD